VISAKWNMFKKKEVSDFHKNLWGISNLGKNRAQITQLNIYDQNLIVSLDLSDFVNLEKLNCSDNKINHLIISSNVNLRELDLSVNNFWKSFLIESFD
jgi:Leucine-rich repeat (LRR) protein